MTTGRHGSTIEIYKTYPEDKKDESKGIDRKQAPRRSTQVVAIDPNRVDRWPG